MTLVITHPFVSAVSEGSDPTLVGPNEWNANHTLTGTVSVAQGGSGITSGTSGGVLYFSGSTTTASSAALAANALVIGGGAGAAPFTASGTTWDNTNLALTIAGATVTTSNPVLNLSQTWNASGVTFTALKLNVTNTASAAASLLMDLQKGGVSKFAVTNTGRINFGDGSDASQINADIFAGPSGGHFFLWTASGPSIIFNQSSFGITASYFGFDTRSQFGNTDGNFFISQAAGVAWGASTFNESSDLVVARDAAGILAQRNLANAQTLRVYNTFTDASNYERGVFDWTTTSNYLTIGTQAGGTGTARNIQLKTASFIGTDGIHCVGTEIDVFVTAADALTRNTSSSRCINIVGNGGGSNPKIVMSSGGMLGFTPNNASGNDGANPGSIDTGISRTVAGVVEINTGTAGTLTSTFIHWGGQQRVTADVTNATASLANATGLAVALVAGRTYSFEAQLSFTDAAAGGIQVAMVASGGLTATNIIYDGWIVDSGANGIKGNAQATSLGGVVASATTTGTAGHVIIYGTITVNVAGTINVQFAQNTSNGTATTIKRGSYLIVHDMP